MRFIIDDNKFTIMEDDKMIELTLAMRKGPTNRSKISVKEYTPKPIPGYDVPQYQTTKGPDFRYFTDSFKYGGFEIWGSDEDVIVDHDDNGDPVYEKSTQWYMDKK